MAIHQVNFPPIIEQAFQYRMSKVNAQRVSSDPPGTPLTDSQLIMELLQGSFHSWLQEMRTDEYPGDIREKYMNAPDNIRLQVRTLLG